MSPAWPGSLTTKSASAGSFASRWAKQQRREWAESRADPDQAKISKFQTPSSKEAPRSKLKNLPPFAPASTFGVWCLRFGTSLELGVWCLVFRSEAAQNEMRRWIRAHL